MKSNSERNYCNLVMFVLIGSSLVDWLIEWVKIWNFRFLDAIWPICAMPMNRRCLNSCNKWSNSLRAKWITWKQMASIALVATCHRFRRFVVRFGHLNLFYLFMMYRLSMNQKLLTFSSASEVISFNIYSTLKMIFRIINRSMLKSFLKSQN